MNLGAIIHDAAVQHGVSVLDMRGNSQRRDVINARVDAAKKLKALPLNLSSKQIGVLLRKHPNNVKRYLRDELIGKRPHLRGSR